MKFTGKEFTEKCVACKGVGHVPIDLPTYLTSVVNKNIKRLMPTDLSTADKVQGLRDRDGKMFMSTNDIERILDGRGIGVTINILICLTDYLGVDIRDFFLEEGEASEKERQAKEGEFVPIVQQGRHHSVYPIHPGWYQIRVQNLKYPPDISRCSTDIIPSYFDASKICEPAISLATGFRDADLPNSKWILDRYPYELITHWRPIYSDGNFYEEEK